MAQLPRAAASEEHSYRQILKSSVLIGGSSVVNIGIGIVRTKVMALLLGPSGVGLMGLYSSIADLVQNIAGMGINSSGVRQIAAAVGTGETKRIAQTATALRRTAVFLGILGAALLLIFSRQVSIFTFGNEQHAGAVALLSLAVCFGAIAGGQSALVQGMRRIADLARMGVLGALFGTVISILFVYFRRERGIVPALVGIAAMSILTSWWYNRKVGIEAVELPGVQLRQEVAALLKLGFAFMASGFLTTGAAYAVRLIVLRKVSFAAAGLYQSAWALGGLYVGFILQAMAADFYPRLTAVSKNNAECNRLVNEQAQISLLLAGPGVIATLTLAPLVIALFYSTKFAAAVPLLRWICLGMTLRVVAWPMGFILVAKGAQGLFLGADLAAALVHCGLAWVCVSRVGLVGGGVAFFGLYVWHGLLVYFIVRKLGGFRWSTSNRKMGSIFLFLISIVFCGFQFLPFWVATGLGAVAAMISGVYSIRTLVALVPPNRIPGWIQGLLVRVGLARSKRTGSAPSV